MTVADAVKDFADRLSDELSPAGEISEAGGLAKLFDTASMVGFDDAEICELLVELSRLLNLTTTALASLTRTADRVGVPARKRVRKAADLLMALGHAPVVAFRLSRVGAAEAGLSALARESRTGGVSVEHRDAVGRGVAFVGRRVSLDESSTAELARRLAGQSTPADVDRRAREIALEWAPVVDEADCDAIPVAENADLNEMSVVTTADGRVAIEADMDALAGEELQQALDPLCRPVLQPDGSPDRRSAGQRRADALGQIIREYLSGHRRPTSSGGVLPHVTLIVPTAPAAGESVASLGFAGPVSSATVGLVLCDAAMRRVRVDEQSAPLDVGREHRLVTTAIRKALEVRDRGCAFPGCGRPVSWTDAHHCTPWSEGGDTSVDNCVLLCRMHHGLVHHSGWQVWIGDDRHPWFREPASAGCAGRVLRSNARRTLTLAPTAAA